MSFKEQSLMTKNEDLVQFYPHIPKKSHVILKKIKTIVCVHNDKLPCDMTELIKLSKKYEIPLISDTEYVSDAINKII
mgnify:CR=1 FL=1